MAQYNPTIALGQLKGKIGSTVFQGGNHTSVIRGRGYRKGSGSASRSLRTAQIVQLSTMWASLTAAQKLAWKGAATTYPFINKFGITYYASAYQCFVAYNSWLLNAGLAALTSPAAVIAPTNEAPFSCTACTVPTITIKWNADPGIHQYIFIYASRPLSQGINMNNPKVKFIQFGDMRGATSINIYNNYHAIYGNFNTGQQVIFKTVCSAPSYGFPYFPSIFNATIT